MGQRNIVSGFQANTNQNVASGFQATANQRNAATSFQANSNQRNAATNLQADSNQRNAASSFQANSNQRNAESFIQANNQRSSSSRSQSNFNQQNTNNRFPQNPQFQTKSLQRSGSTFDSSSDSIDGALEPLNLPSGASFLLGSISTSFSCPDRPYGYYADQENSCRLFHICNPIFFSNGAVETYQYSFMCGEGSMFDQQKLTCVAESEAIPCQESSSFFFTNEQFGRPEEKTF